MTYSIEVSDTAEKDLFEIFEYIAYTLGSKTVATKHFNLLEESILSLNTFPQKFQKYAKEPWNSRGLRCMPVKNFVVCYIPNKQTQQVIVTRVLYARRNIEEVLRQEEFTEEI